MSFSGRPRRTRASFTCPTAVTSRTWASTNSCVGSVGSSSRSMAKRMATTPSTRWARRSGAAGWTLMPKSRSAWTTFGPIRRLVAPVHTVPSERSATPTSPKERCSTSSRRSPVTRPRTSLSTGGSLRPSRTSRQSISSSANLSSRATVNSGRRPVARPLRRWCASRCRRGWQTIQQVRCVNN